MMFMVGYGRCSNFFFNVCLGFIIMDRWMDVLYSCYYCVVFFLYILFWCFFVWFSWINLDVRNYVLVCWVNRVFIVCVVFFWDFIRVSKDWLVFWVKDIEGVVCVGVVILVCIVILVNFFFFKLIVLVFVKRVVML